MDLPKCVITARDRAPRLLTGTDTICTRLPSGKQIQDTTEIISDNLIRHVRESLMKINEIDSFAEPRAFFWTRVLAVPVHL